MRELKRVAFSSHVVDTSARIEIWPPRRRKLGSGRERGVCLELLLPSPISPRGGGPESNPPGMITRRVFRNGAIDGTAAKGEIPQSRRDGISLRIRARMAPRMSKATPNLRPNQKTSARTPFRWMPSGTF